MERKQFLDAARGIAIIFVAVYHVTTISVVKNWLGSFQLYVFFLISGFLFSDCGILPFCKKKFKKLMVPYFLWGFVSFLYFFLIERHFRNVSLTPFDCVVGLLTGDERLLDFNAPLWFIPCFLLVEFLYFFAYRFFNFVFRRCKKKEVLKYSFLFGAILLLCLLFVIFDVDFKLFSIYRVPFFLFAFFVGNLFSILSPNYRFKNKRVRFLLVFVSIAMFSFGFILSYYEWATIIPIILSIFATFALSFSTMHFGVLKIIGKQSLSVMLLHGPIFRVLIGAVCILPYATAEGIRNDIVLSLMIAIVSVLLCVLINFGLQFFENKVWIKYDMYNRLLKRFLDVIVSSIAILVLSPLFVVLIVVGSICMKGNPFFVQIRPGRNDKSGKETLFRLIKFRTMTNEKDSEGNLLPDEQRLGKYGAFLRSTSLDELPELINIFTGKMSFVGPRPQLVKDLAFMNGGQRKRHSVRPGLTGLAQVNGRNSITWEKKFELDLEYIDRVSFSMDCEVFFKTIFKVFVREGVVREGTASDLDFGDWLLQNGTITKQEYDCRLQQANDLILNGAQKHE